MRSADPDGWGPRGLVGLLIGIAAIWQGCNVFAGLDDVKFEGSGGAAGGAAGSGAAGSGNGGGTTTTTSSGPGTGGTSTSSAQGGAAGSTSTTGGTGGVTTSSGPGTGGSGASSSSSSSSGGSGGGVSSSIDCGNGLECMLGQQACCWNNYDSSAPAKTGECLDLPVDSALCNNSSTVAGMHSIVECERNAQCSAGEVCCGTTTMGPAGTYYTQVTCKLTCNGGSNEFLMCDGAGDMTTCPAGTTCLASPILPAGFYRCKP